MIKQAFVTICDLCGKIGRALEQGTQRDIGYLPPKGWTVSRINANVHICPECSAKLEGRESK